MIREDIKRCIDFNRRLSGFDRISDAGIEVLENLFMKLLKQQSERATLSLLSFLTLSDREKWTVGKKLEGVKWGCPSCGQIVDDGAFPEHPAPFPGLVVRCGYCDFELTRRTGGGQNDPFNYIFIEDGSGSDIPRESGKG